MATKAPKNIQVTYECDLLGDHTAEISALAKKETIEFFDEMDALHFIAECTSYSSNITIVAPHLFTHVNNEYEEQALKEGKPTLRELEEFRINNLFN